MRIPRRTSDYAATALVPLLLAATLVGCAERQSHLARGAPIADPTRVELIRSFDIPELGACQGVEVRDGLIYFYGDADTGVIREYELRGEGARADLHYTGREVRLTRDGVDLIPHPTGLTHHPEYGTFLGNTVAGHGTIYQLDWPRMWADGDLDHAVLHTIQDDAAINGTRPEFVRIGADWLVATADYGDVDNAVRFYNPARLAAAAATSDPGVLVGAFHCSPWVQNLHWREADNKLVLVQNQIAGLRWRLTLVAIAAADRANLDAHIVAFAPVDELEGMHTLPADHRGAHAVFVTSSPAANVWLARIHHANNDAVR